MFRIKNRFTLVSVLCALLLSFSFIGCGQNKSEKEVALVNGNVPDSKISATKADSIVVFAKSLLGKPYRFSSCGPNEFDCSGFVYYVFNKFNVNLSRSSYTMAEEGQAVLLSDAVKGDLIFFKGTNLKDPGVGHVGIIISEKGSPVEFIHSSSGTHSGIVITKLSESNYQARFIKVKRFF